MESKEPETTSESKLPVPKRQRVNRLIKRYWIGLLVLVFIGATLVWGPTIYANLSTRSVRYDLQKTSISRVPQKDVAIVFGAGLYDGDKPTAYLRWRVETSVQLYKAHRVKKLLMTGDNSRKSHDEPTAMKKLAVSLGVPASDIVLDYAGFDTYDSCYRAHMIFKVTSATLVTQGYHLPRAVMACRALGIQAIGVDARHDDGRSWGANYIIREWLATDKMVPKLIFKPKPVLGKVEPIQL